MHSFDDKLNAAARMVHRDHPLAAYTTMGVGGTADYLVIAESAAEITDTIRLCLDHRVPYKMLGGGSNVIISDRGFRGVVIINRFRHWKLLDDRPAVVPPAQTAARLATLGDQFYHLEGLEYSDRDAPPVLVQVGAGARIVPLMKALYKINLTGLQWFAGIPATVGGAIYMNMHGARDFFGDLVHSALIFNGRQTRRVDHDWFAFDYDWSKLHDTGEIVLSAELVLRRGDPRQAWNLSRDWARRKALQPQKSAGCIFHNLTPAEQQRLELPTPSIGYLLDRVLGLKGLRRGDAIISPSHAAFIENLGKATAADVYALFQQIRETAREKLNLDLQPEVEFIGDF